MPSINLLFSSAADAFGERLIAIILTETGSDGASGAYQVKASGGLVIIENPETAAYPALPASLAPTTVDFVANLERIGPLLYEILTSLDQPTHASLLADEPASQETQRQWHGQGQAIAQSEPALQQLLNHVRERSNIDFSQYKMPTIVRRLQRRVFATGTTDLAGYLSY